MIPAWRLIGRSGGRFPVPLMQDPLVQFILLFFLFLMLFSELWWVSTFILITSSIIAHRVAKFKKEQEEWQKDEWARIAAARRLYQEKKIPCITLDTLYEEYHGKPRTKK